jgi:HlyD family secretion protein
MATDNNTPLNDMAEQVHAVIRSEHSRSRFSRVIGAGIVLLVIAALSWWLWPREQPIQWQLHTLDRGDMVLSATATGNLQAKSEITVGAEISGLIREVLVDENDQVNKGDVLARFNTDELQVSLQQANARLALARASVKEAEASLEEAQLNLQRSTALVKNGSVSQAEFDSLKAAQSRASAKLSYAHASVREAEASVSQAETRLQKAVITSPINGVVLQRNIEPGNTVAASFQAPELFLLAEDLSQMELHVSLDEADVGQVKTGQQASFTVDAWPSQSFNAEVLKVYLYPSIENNVVTYTTVLGVDNSDNLLKPGMTATATITTGRRDQVLRVPNMAFRFTPPAEQQGGGLFSHPASRNNNGKGGSNNTVWLLHDAQPQRLLIATGFSDGRFTEVLSDELKPGDQLVIGILDKPATQR